MEILQIYSRKNTGTVIRIQIRYKEMGKCMYRVLVADDEPIERMIVGKIIRKNFEDGLRSQRR